jgi:hypothetical protein
MRDIRIHGPFRLTEVEADIDSLFGGMLRPANLPTFDLMLATCSEK